MIFGTNDINPLEETPASRLPIEMRLLHNIINKILFPKIDRFDFIFERNLVLMFCVIEGILVNLPRLMLDYMCEASTKKYASLPYRMVIALILREFKVPISEEEPKRTLKHTEVYNV